MLEVQILWTKIKVFLKLSFIKQYLKFLTKIINYTKNPIIWRSIDL